MMSERLIAPVYYLSNGFENGLETTKVRKTIFGKSRINKVIILLSIIINAL